MPNARSREAAGIRVSPPCLMVTGAAELAYQRHCPGCLRATEYFPLSFQEFKLRCGIELRGVITDQILPRNTRDFEKPGIGKQNLMTAVGYHNSFVENLQDQLHLRRPVRFLRLKGLKVSRGQVFCSVRKNTGSISSGRFKAPGRAARIGFGKIPASRVAEPRGNLRTFPRQTGKTGLYLALQQTLGAKQAGLESTEGNAQAGTRFSEGNSSM